MGGPSNNILRLNIKKEPVIDPNTVCKTYPELTAQQYHLCRKFPDVTASAIQGVQVAVHECQYQLRTHRWNCSALEKKNKNPHASPILARGYKETAFAYAISAAGITHQVSKACSMGKLESCGCDMNLHGRRGRDPERARAVQVSRHVGLVRAGDVLEGGARLPKGGPRPTPQVRGCL
ncbi:protein wnt [Plakobranchus ocellatus]|uniref:Protein Wnt n=1 Tax=Plakobranchus ocellatus TaxID=259542 RepID=A0AAV4D087_9GAST|nr:protein wnt [Plakobranchus ocellatus]